MKDLRFFNIDQNLISYFVQKGVLWGGGTKSSRGTQTQNFVGVH